MTSSDSGLPSKLTPQGRVWPQDRESVLQRLLDGLAIEEGRVAQRVRDLLAEMDPRTTLELLADWERVAGLPDQCGGLQPTVEARRKALVARLDSTGSQTPEAMRELAAALGYDVEIVEHPAFHVETSTVEEPLVCHGRPFWVEKTTVESPLDEHVEWAYTADVVTEDVTVTEFKVETGHVEEPLATWGNSLLECTLRAAWPAHMAVRFLYPTPQWNVLLFVLDDVGVERFALYGRGEGARYARTPRFDRLAAEGVRFTRAFAQPVCGPTRAGLNTGRYGHRTGFGANITGLNLELSQDEYMLHERVRDGAGQATYARGYFGKYHLCASIGRERHMTQQGTQRYIGSIGNIGSDPANGSIDHYDFRLVSSTPSSDSTTILTGPPFDETRYSSSVFRNAFLSWVQGTTKPFAAHVCYNAPHEPFTCPPDSLLSPETVLELREAGIFPGDVLGVPPGITPEEFDRVNLLFDACIEATDTEIGRAIDGLSAEQRAHTLIVVCGDNGTPANVIRPPYLPQHGKASPYRQGGLVPMVVVGPPALVKNPGRTCDRLVHAIDWWATVEEVLGLDVGTRPPGLVIDAVSYLPHLQSATSPELRTEVLLHTYVPNGPPRPLPDTPRSRDFRGIYDTDDWSYVYLYANGVVQEFLFDPSDYRQEVNLLDSPLSPEATAKLAALTARVDEILDGWT